MTYLRMASVHKKICKKKVGILMKFSCKSFLRKVVLGIVDFLKYVVSSFAESIHI